MSNFFDSLRKAELIRPEEYPLSSHRDAIAREVVDKHAPQPAEPETPTARVAAQRSPRSASLKISSATPILPFDQKTNGAAEQYRVIRTKLLHHPAKPQAIVISSAGSGDGKTVTAINLAASFALKADVRVVLLDADMRRPQVANYLGLENGPGLSDVLHGTASWEDAAVWLGEIPRLCVLPAGLQRETQSELLDSDQWRNLIARLRKEFQYVVIDAPPIATVADYELVQVVCDGVVFVARPDHSQRKTCLKCIESVPREKFLGVVVNCVEDWFLWRTNNYYYAQAGR